MAARIEVMMPTSPVEASEAFATAGELTVVGGATIVMPELRAGRLQTGRVMLLSRAGMDAVQRDGDRLRLGAATTLEDLRDVPEPLATAVANVADREIRRQATIGGNICAPPGSDGPRGDLQGPLIALGARVRWTAGGGERTEPIEDFLRASADRRLVLDIELTVPRRGGFAALRRPHARSYTALAVSCAEVGGELRLAATGLAPHGVRLRSAQDPTPVPPALAEPPDDPLASAWYRREMLPVLVRRCLADMERPR